MKRKAIFFVIGILLLALLVWAFAPAPTEVEIAAVTQGRFERSVQEDGKTRLRERYVVSTPLTGRVARIHLKQGDKVQSGDAVATLWPVARAQANVARAAAALDQARAELKRSETLAQQGFVSPNQNETGRLNVRLREKELESARQEAVAARHELAQSRIALRQYSQPMPTRQDGPQRAYEVKAPVSGKVLKIPQQSEGVVTAGTPLMEIGNPTQLEVVVDILTEDAAQIKPGTRVQLSNWGGPEVLQGQVRLIEPAAFTKVSALGVEEQRVNAIVDIASPPEKWSTLGDGFKVDVRLVVQQVENAVKVPVSALFPLGARSALFVLDKGHAQRREIDVAARNGVDAWVKSGLSKGTQVIVYPDTKLKDGDSVKTR